MRIAKNWLIWNILFVVLLVFSWSLLQPSFFRLHDYTHVARIVEMQRSLVAGHWPVQWTQNFGYGYGMPLFLFYGPLPFYLATIMSLIGIAPLWAMKLTFVLSGVVALGGMYGAMQRFGRTAALISATLLLAAPYRAVDIFVRGALNEVWAIAFLPWFLWGALAVPKHPKFGAVLLAGATAAVILSHNLTALFGLPILALVSLVWLMIHPNRLRSVMTCLGAGMLGVAMSVFYSVPAFVEKGETTISAAILGGYFDYHLHFLYIRQLLLPRWGYGGSEYGPNDGMSFHVGTLAIVVLVGTVLAISIQAFRKLKRSYSKKIKFDLVLKKILTPHQLFFFSTLFILGVTLFMTLNHAMFIWDALPIFSFIQFPWRFLAVASVLTAVLVGLALTQVRQPLARWGIGAVILISTIVFQSPLHQGESTLKQPDDFYYTDAARIRTNMSSILPDYIPIQFDQTLPPVNPENRIVVTGSAAETNRYELNLPHQILLFTQAPSESTVKWNIAHFPGWKYWINGAEVYPTLKKDGRMELTSPEAIDTVGASFESTPLRSYTAIISLIATVVWISLLLPLPRKNYVARS